MVELSIYMGKGAKVALILGVLLIIGGIISLVMLAIGTNNSTTTGNESIPSGMFYVIGGKSAEKEVKYE